MNQEHVQITLREVSDSLEILMQSLNHAPRKEPTEIGHACRQLNRSLRHLIGKLRGVIPAATSARKRSSSETAKLLDGYCQNKDGKVSLH